MTDSSPRTSVTCRQFIDLLLRYLEGELAPAVKLEFDRHLSDCPSCVHYMRTYTEAVRLGKAAFSDDDQPVPDAVPEELVQAIIAARTKDG